MISAVLFISFFVFLILGVPIALCLGLSSVCAILYSGTSLTIVATNMYSGISKFLLLAIPFFVLSGNIMAKAGISRRLIDFVDTCVGHKKGGIAIVCVIVSCFFGAISGSGPATVAALGAVLIPAMVEQGGFSAPFSTALMATASSVAIVIPPSIAFVVYASITGVSIADMFMAGIVPGILMGVALVIVVLLEANKHDIKPSRQKASAKERWATFKDAFWGFLMPVIILGGIYGGIFTPTEAAAVSVVYGLFVGMVIYREVSFRDLFDPGRFCKDYWWNHADRCQCITVFICMYQVWYCRCCIWTAWLYRTQSVCIPFDRKCYFPDRRMFYRCKLSNVYLYPDHASGM